MARCVLLMVCVCVAASTVGCKSNTSQPQPASTAPAPAMKPAPPTPLAEKKDELGGTTWDPQWDAMIEQELPADLLSETAARAVRPYCPRFAEESEADKRAFWAYVFQALASAEAGLNPDTDVHHLQRAVNKTDQVTKRPIHQEGLLQLTYEDEKRYGCNFDWEHDRTLPAKDPDRTILQPANNLSCGVKIMEDQIITQKKPLVSRTSYWATLQPGTVSYRVFAKQMANVPAACGLHERTEHERRPRRRR